MVDAFVLEVIPTDLELSADIGDIDKITDLAVFKVLTMVNNLIKLKIIK